MLEVCSPLSMDPLTVLLPLFQCPVCVCRGAVFRIWTMVRGKGGQGLLEMMEAGQFWRQRCDADRAVKGAGPGDFWLPACFFRGKGDGVNVQPINSVPRPATSCPADPPFSPT